MVIEAPHFHQLQCQNPKCQKEFLAGRSDKKYCSLACRQSSYRARGGKLSNEKLNRISSLHKCVVMYYYPIKKVCSECGCEWPCDTMRIIYGEKVERE